MKLKLAARKTESPGVESFIFKPEKPLVWKAGQFLHYVLNHSGTMIAVPTAGSPLPPLLAKNT